MEELYERYFDFFKDDQKPMAASLSSIIYSMQVINSFKLKRILDIGSGVSTLLFSAVYDNVTSVDTNEEWGRKTECVIRETLDKDAKVNIGISSVENGNHDFIFYDYGNLEDRIYNFPKILKMRAKFIYLDDMHIIPYRYYVESRIKGALKLTYLPKTIDEFGRFGAILTKK